LRQRLEVSDDSFRYEVKTDCRNVELIALLIFGKREKLFE
jgi:hypothetical protein